MKYITKCPVCGGDVDEFKEWSEPRPTRKNKEWSGVKGSDYSMSMSLVSMDDISIDYARRARMAEIDICPKCWTAFS